MIIDEKLKKKIKKRLKDKQFGVLLVKKIDKEEFDK